MRTFNPKEPEKLIFYSKFNYFKGIVVYLSHIKNA